MLEIPYYEFGYELFEFNSKKYLFLVDYCTKYVELEEINLTSTSHNVVKILKRIFA